MRVTDDAAAQKTLPHEKKRRVAPSAGRALAALGAVAFIYENKELAYCRTRLVFQLFDE